MFSDLLSKTFKHRLGGMRQAFSGITVNNTAAKQHRTSICGLPWLLALATPIVFAQSNFEENFDDKEKPWQEIVVQLPPLPQKENLLEFSANPTSTLAFAVDGKSISVGTDGVVRYTLVAKSTGGAENISYEGIRCKLFEKKLYAFGHKNGTWSRSRRDQWEAIPSHQTYSHHTVLARDYFCDGSRIAGNAAEIAERLRWKRPLPKGKDGGLPSN